MRDFDVRNALHLKTLRPFYDDGESRVVDELSLCQGEAIVDVAVVNGQLHGYELKSGSDTLTRLPHQIETYSKVLDRVTLVVADRHIDEARLVLPKWWGIIRAKEVRGRIYLKSIRKPRNNPLVDLYSLAQLLWKKEALDLLCKFGIANGVKSKPRKYLWQRLAEQLDYSDLSYGVRSAIKERPERQSVRPRRQNGGSSQRLPKLFDCLSSKPS